MADSNLFVLTFRVSERTLDLIENKVAEMRRNQPGLSIARADVIRLAVEAWLGGK